MIKSFSLIQWIIIIILALLTALEPLSIDLYLPGFIMISETFGASISAVQISLSTFLGGFAIGQLIWGPLADRFGRKKPILLSLLIFIAASVACIYVKTIEQLWVVRFIQAIGGCGGIVISRAIVTDYFDKSDTLKIFALLAVIMGIAPIVAPSIGNGVLHVFEWEGLFGAMAILGVVLFLLTLFLLPETLKKQKSNAKSSVLTDYLQILQVKKFVIYALLAGIVNGALMIYVANGPLIIMDKGGFSSDMFSIIFATNAFGLMISSFVTSRLQRYIATNKLVKLALLFMFAVSLILLALMYINAHIIIILVALFFYIFPLGILLPTTTELAITPFTENSGAASSLFGAIQLAVAFVCSIVSNYINDESLLAVGISFFLCSLFAFAIVFIKVDTQKEFSKEAIK